MSLIIHVTKHQKPLSNVVHRIVRGLALDLTFKYKAQTSTTDFKGLWIKIFSLSSLTLLFDTEMGGVQLIS